MPQGRMLRSNIVSLSLIQGANYVLPLLTLPYLVRVLGPEKFGLVVFVQGFVQYFVILTDYGFNLSATRFIAINRDDDRKISELFCATMLSKTILMAFSIVLLVLAIAFIPRCRSEWLLYCISFLAVPGSVLFPVWLFQGMEQMRCITIASISAKLLSTVSIFIFVHSEADYHRVAAIQAGGLLLAGFLGLCFAHKVAHLRYSCPSRRAVAVAFREGWHVFISNAAVTLYTNSNVVILGLMTDNRTVGIFSAADKIIMAVRGLISPVSQAIYPRINVLAKESRNVAMKFLRQCLHCMGSLLLLISCVLFLGADFFVSLLVGSKFSQSAELVRYMAFIPFLAALNNIFGIQTMLTFGLKSEFFRVILACGIVNIAMIIPLTAMFGARGMAITVTITEIIVTFAMATVLRIKGYRFTEKAGDLQ